MKPCTQELAHLAPSTDALTNILGIVDEKHSYLGTVVEIVLFLLGAGTNYYGNRPGILWLPAVGLWLLLSCGIYTGTAALIRHETAKAIAAGVARKGDKAERPPAKTDGKALTTYGDYSPIVSGSTNVHIESSTSSRTNRRNRE